MTITASSFQQRQSLGKSSKESESTSEAVCGLFFLKSRILSKVRQSRDYFMGFPYSPLKPRPGATTVFS